MIINAPLAPDRELAIRRRVHRLAEFYRHAAVFATMMVPVWTANIITLQFWPAFAKNGFFAIGIFVSVMWVIGLVSHGITVLPFWRFLTQDWEDRKVREILDAEVNGRKI